MTVTKPISLFDHNSIDNYSRTFYLDNQMTIYATGLTGNDQIRFELIRVGDGDPAKRAGCNFSELVAAGVEGIQDLQCPDCEVGGAIKLVRLTPKNPFIVLDFPKESLLRAVYEPEDPTDNSLGTMSVWAVNNRYPVTDLTSAMRGCEPTCCEEWPLEDWLPSEEWRCNLETDMEERKYYGHCHGYYDWRDEQPILWEETGATRCNLETHEVEVQEVNRCGNLRWVPHETETCGWIPTYELPCGGLAFRPEDDRDPEATVEIDGCGGDTVAYIYPTPTPHATKAITGCESCEDGQEVIGYAFPDGRADCDPCQGNPGDWVPTGKREYAGDFEPNQYYVKRQMINGCGHYDWIDAGLAEWQDTGATRCVESDIERQQATEFGQTRWVFDHTATWADTGITRCSITNDEDIENEQVSECGAKRWVADAEGAIQLWVETGVQRCADHVVEQQEVNQCGRLRWTPSDASCGYLPTYQLPCGGLAFREDDMRDPEATTALEDCDGNLIAYVYPTPRHGASTPVTGCATCEDSELMGYATDGGTVSPDCHGPKEASAVQVFEKQGQQFILWSNGATTPL